MEKETIIRINFKGMITERLVRHYIRKEVIPTLKKEGYDDVILTPAWAKFEFSWFKDGTFLPERQFFIAKCFFPTNNFLKKFEKLTELLKNVPDGFLVKLKKTGKFKSLKNALSELKLDKKLEWNCQGHQFVRSMHKDNELLPIVKGGIEVVEVKSDKSFIAPHQRKSYKKRPKEGYQLRCYHVNIKSFEKNYFIITEKLVKNVLELDEWIKWTRQLK